MAAPTSEGPVASAISPARGGVRLWLAPSRTMPRSLVAPALGLAYIAVIAGLGGLRVDHVIMGSLGVLDVYNEKSRAFLRAFLPFMLAGVVFDSMRYFYWLGVAGRVHTLGPYELDRHLFGIHGHTLNELFAAHHWAIADLASGVAYLTFIGAYLALAFVAFLRGNSAGARTLGRCFLLVNLLGFLTYFIFPVAPPWYVAAHGFGPVTHAALPSAAAAHRFDQLLGTHFFDGVYNHGVDTFGALPSLHCAYPFMGAVLAFRIPQLRWLRWPAAAFSALMCFSAVYLQHHYVIDVLAGLAYGSITLATVLAWERRRAAPGPALD